jgi:MFS family permease
LLNIEQFSALKHPQFLKYWLGSFTSVGATQLQVMGLGWLVYELSGSALALGYLGAAAGLPAVLTTLFGGALADNLDKRHLLMVTSLLIAGLLGLLAFLDQSGLVEVWHVIAITGAISVVTGFDWPVRQAIFPSLIDRKDMMSAVALTTVIWQACRMVMPAFGGIIIAVSDTWVLFACCSVGFFAMFLVIADLKVKPSEPVAKQSTYQQIKEGVSFILNTRLFLILLALSYAMFFFPSTYMQLMPAFVDMLGTNEEGYGYLLSITGIGSVTGTILSGYLQRSTRLGFSMLISALIFCGFVYLFALASYSGVKIAFYLALASLFAASIFSAIFMITSTTVLQMEVPDHLRGRVMGFHAITYNMLPLGALFAGAIANATNPALAVSISTTIFVGLVLWVLLADRSVVAVKGQYSD